MIVTQNRKHKPYSKAAKKKHAIKSWKAKRANLREAVVTLRAKKKDLLKDYRVIRSERKSIVSKILQLEIKCQLDETGATRKLYENKFTQYEDIHLSFYTRQFQLKAKLTQVHHDINYFLAFL